MLQPAKSLTFFLFSFFLPAHGHEHTQTDTHRDSQVLLLSSSFCWWPSVHIWRTKHSKNDTVTNYTITFISLFRTEKKYSLTSTCPWIVMYLWTIYQRSLMKGIHVTESSRAFGEPWDWCQRGNVVECVCSRLRWKKWLPEIILAGVGETEKLLTEVQCWTGTQLSVLPAISAPWYPYP